MPKGNDGRLPWRRLLALCVSALLALSAVGLAAGCGNSSKSSSASTTTTVARRVVRVQAMRYDRWTYARGRFNELCAGCHTLSDAGARGKRFNLDHSGPSQVEETHVRSTIAEGEPGMPAWREVLSPREYEELVAYVVAVAKRTPGEDRWHQQLAMRAEGNNWSRAKELRLDRYARRLAERPE